MKIPERIGETTSYAMYRVEKLAEQVYHIDDQIDNPSSMYCLIGSEKVLWIDTSNKHEGYEKELYEIAITLANGKPILVAITHDHYDHTGALEVFKKEEIYFPKKEASKDLPVDVNGLEDGDCLDLGDLNIEVVEVPGHTPRSVAFVEKNKEWVITGDAIGSSYVWLFFMEDVLETYKKGIHHLYDHIKDFKNPLFMCGHRHQQFPSQDRDPLSPINDPMTMQYVLDMMTLVEKIENHTATTRSFDILGKPDEHCVYSFEGSKAEIDSFVSLMK